ncbi:MAG: hypothetical protein NTW29_18865 [Bacteroidetes bacterium]|nr:hypothetical protein [Bacteroidota bacterium]
MNTKSRLLFLGFLLISFGLFAQGNTGTTTQLFTSLEVPQAYHSELKYLQTDGTVVTKNADEVKHDKSYLGSFPSLVSSVTIYQVDKEGGLSLLGNSLSSKGSKYVVIYDYTQTQTIHITDANGTSYHALIGVSVRMVAKINSKSNKINIANLYGLGIAAGKNQISGSLEVRVNGINSQKINELIPVTADLSQASIGTALQSVASIKSHIYDAETNITPYFIAWSVVKDQPGGKTPNVQSLSDSVRTFQFTPIRTNGGNK